MEKATTQECRQSFSLTYYHLNKFLFILNLFCFPKYKAQAITGTLFYLGFFVHQPVKLGERNKMIKANNYWLPIKHQFSVSHWAHRGIVVNKMYGPYCHVSYSLVGQRDINYTHNCTVAVISAVKERCRMPWEHETGSDLMAAECGFLGKLDYAGPNRPCFRPLYPESRGKYVKVCAGHLEKESVMIRFSWWKRVIVLLDGEWLKGILELI